MNDDTNQNSTHSVDEGVVQETPSSDQSDNDSDTTILLDNECDDVKEEEVDLICADSDQKTEDSNDTKTFNNLEELENHIFMNVRKENLKCFFCDVQLETRRLVLEHMETKHAENKVLLCALCDGIFQNYSDLAVHSAEKHALYGHQCALCSNFYQVESEYSEHYKSEHGDSILKCEVCQQVFQDAVAFSQHDDCNTCGMKFSDKLELRKHEATHLSQALAEVSDFMKRAEEEKRQTEKMKKLKLVQMDDDGEWSAGEDETDATNSNKLSCALCDANFTRNRELSHHSKVCHSLSGMKCKTCLAFFQIESEYKAHPCGGDSDEEDKPAILLEQFDDFNDLKSNHDDNKSDQDGMLTNTADNSQTPDDANPKPAGDKTTKKRPKRMLANPKECYFCHEIFPSKILRENHETEVHTGDYKECKICGKKLSNKQGFRIHMRNHNITCSFKCELCGKMYPYKGNLKYHLASVHMNQRNFTCCFCGQTFNRKRHLLIHENLHQGIMSFKCSFCDEMFRSKTSRDRHVQDTHTGRKYQCDVCGKRFTTQCFLKHHMIIHTGEKPFKCPQCDARFKRKHHVTQHLQRHYKDPTTDDWREMMSLPVLDLHPSPRIGSNSNSKKFINTPSAADSR